MITGHEKIADKLKILADAEKLSHGYIFFGSAMVGKRTVAAAFANYLETGKFEEPAILGDYRVIDLAYMKSLDPDAKDSIGIEAVREIKNFLWQKPNRSRYRTLVIDGGERLTAEAQNAILKIAEEPPQSALFILITDDIEGLLPTVASRLNRIYFAPVSAAKIEQWLVKEKIATATEAKKLATHSFGKPGLALLRSRDEEFQASVSEAAAFFKKTAIARKEFLKKKLAEEDGFVFRKFLDAMILVLTAEAPDTAKKRELWHKLLELRGRVGFNPNPRLQLEALFV